MGKKEKDKWGYFKPEKTITLILGKRLHPK